MKKIIPILIFFASIGIGFSQNEINIYEDALKFSKKEITIDDLEKKYGLLAGNKYFKDFLEDDPKKVDSKADNRSFSMISKKNTDISPLVDGIASFLVSRAKKELSISFFNNFKNQINNDKYKDFQIMFNNTHQELNLIDEKVYDFQPYILSLKNKFKDDIDTLSTSFNKVVKADNTQLGKYLSKNEKIKIPVWILSDLLDGLHQKKHIGTVIESLNYQNLKLTDPSAIKIRKSIDLLRLFSFALRNKEAEKQNKNYYISKVQIEELTKNDTFQNAFFGLLTAVSRSKNSSSLEFDSDLYEILNSKSDKLGDWVGLIKKINEATELIQRTGKTDSLKLSNYFNGCSKLLATLPLIFKTAINQDIKVENFSKNLVKISEMAYSLKAKEYTRSLTLFTSVISSYEFNGKSAHVVRFLNKYGMFIAQMTDAKSREQVEEILEYFAAPIGSWRDKSKDNFSITVDSHAGLGNSFSKNISDSSYFFVSTPIGISLSRSLFNHKASVSILGSIIDVGAITSFRFKDNETQLVPIYLKQIFAPGLILSVQPYYKFPIFINVGRQRSTTLNKIESNGTQSNLSSYWRTFASLNVNIPITYILKR